MVEKIKDFYVNLENYQKKILGSIIFIIIFVPYYPIISYYYFGPFEPIILADNHCHPLKFHGYNQLDVFPNFTADDTMNGTSWEVPYIFENLIISNANQGEYALSTPSIMISDSNRTIIIQNCIFSNRIILNNCSNIIIRNCYLKEKGGIRLFNSHDCLIFNNKIYYYSGLSGIAIEILLSSNNNITYNEISHCAKGIIVGSLSFSTDNIISHNSINYNREEGLSVYSENIENQVFMNYLFFNSNELGQYAPIFLTPFFFIPPIYLTLISIKRILDEKHIPKPKEEDFTELI